MDQGGLGALALETQAPWIGTAGLRLPEQRGVGRIRPQDSRSAESPGLASGSLLRGLKSTVKVECISPSTFLVSGVLQTHQCICFVLCYLLCTYSSTVSTSSVTEVRSVPEPLSQSSVVPSSG